MCLCLCLRVDEQWHRAEERLVYGVENNSTLLECVPRSLQARVLWFLQKGGEKLEVSLMDLQMYICRNKIFHYTDRYGKIQYIM